MKSKKYYGVFNPAATSKALKGSDRYSCQVTDDGTIYACNGYFAVKLTADDYAAIIQPVSLCDPGNWLIDKNGKHDSSFDIAKAFNNAVEAAKNASELTAAPFTTTAFGGKHPCACYYNSEADFAAFYNPLYLSIFETFLTIRAANPISAAVVGDQPVGIVLPVRPKPEISRAVKAYFTDCDNNDSDNNDSDNNNSAELEKLRGDLILRNNDLLQANDEIKRLQAELADLQSKAPEQKPEPRTAAELIASRFADMAGVTTTIKGAQTAAPVVWLTGDTQKHADAIKAAGGKWSNKKSAYYVCVA